MDANAPLSLLTAGYTSREAALRDFQALWAARHDGGFHHTSIALLGRGPDGRLHVERSSSTAKHLSWGGALLAGPLSVLAPATGAEMLTVVGLSGAGVLIEHLRQHARPDELRRSRNTLRTRPWSLLVVALDLRCQALTAHMAQAVARSTVEMAWGDLEESLCQDFTRPLPESLLLPS
jgi:hypothetical protein